MRKVCKILNGPYQAPISPVGPELVDISRGHLPEETLQTVSVMQPPLLLT